MSGNPVGINAKTALATFQTYSDRVAIARANKLYRVDSQYLPSRFTSRIPLVVPQISDFSTVVNLSTSRTVQKDDCVRIHAPSNTPTGANLMSRVRTLPGGSWDVQLALLRGWTFLNFINGGLTLRESGTGKQIVFGFGAPNDQQIILNRYTNFNSFGAAIESAPESNIWFQFFRALKNGSNIDYYFSTDGVCWSYHHTHALTVGFTTAPDQWGFYIELNNSTTAMQMDVLHWDE